MKSKFFTPRYAAIQGAYWSFYCIFYNYAANFMEDKGFTSTNIGLILAVGNIFAVIMQPIMASMIDKSKKISIRGAICGLVLGMVAGSLAMFFFQDVKWIIPIIFILISMMLQTMQPLANSLALECENFGNQIQFGLARGCGSWAFAITSLIIGSYLTKHSVRMLPIFYFGVFVFGFIAVRTFVYPDLRKNVVQKEKESGEGHSGLLSFARYYPKFCLMLVGIVLLFFNHIIINNFLVYIVDNIGGNSSHMGIALAVAAFFELPAMAMFSKMRKKVSIRSLIIFSCVMFSVKHIIILFTTNLIVLIAAHALQMLSYAVFLPGSIYYVDAIMDKEDAVKGQAYVTMAITTSNILGSLLGGAFISWFGVFKMMLIGSIVSVIGGIIVSMSVEKIK